MALLLAFGPPNVCPFSACAAFGGPVFPFWGLPHCENKHWQSGKAEGNKGGRFWFPHLPSNSKHFWDYVSATLFLATNRVRNIWSGLKVDAHLLVSNSLINGGELVSVGGERPMPSSSVREAFDTAKFGIFE